jgi:hypothetical protein
LDERKGVMVQFVTPFHATSYSKLTDYNDLSMAFKHETNCVVSTLNLAENPIIRERLQINDFPHFKFYPRGKKTNESGIRYDFKSTQEAIYHLNKNCGTGRKIDGNLHKNAGLISALREILDEFVEMEPERKDQKNIERYYKETEILLNKIKESGEFQGEYFDASSEYYLKVLKNIEMKGMEYVANELRRIDNVLRYGHSNQALVDNMTIRRNVLRYFYPADVVIPKSEF